MAGIFESEFIFLGGDEVDTSCWLKNQKISAWLHDHNMTDKELFGYFWQQVSSEVLPQLEGKTVGVWQSDKLEIDPKLLPSGSFGNVWQSPKKMADVIDAGMPVVLSGTWYLDQENPETAAGPCMEYAWQQTWKCMWAEEPSDQLDNGQMDYFMGGMAAMWGEGVYYGDFEARVWAKAAAVAERLWASSVITDVQGAQARLDRHICRLNMMGITAGPIIPGFCPSDLQDPALSW